MKADRKGDWRRVERLAQELLASTLRNPNTVLRLLFVSQTKLQLLPCKTVFVTEILNVTQTNFMLQRLNSHLQRVSQMHSDKCSHRKTNDYLVQQYPVASLQCLKERPIAPSELTTVASFHRQVGSKQVRHILVTNVISRILTFMTAEQVIGYTSRAVHGLVQVSCTRGDPKITGTDLLRMRAF
jgi:hypothetical protein